MTRRGLGAAVAALGAAALAPAARAEEKAPPQLKMGLLQGMFRDMPPAMAQTLSKPFRELILKQTGFGGDVEVLPGPIDLATKLREKELHLGVFHGFEYAWAQKLCPDLQPLVVTAPIGGKVQGLVVVSADSKYKMLADLGDETVAIPRGAKAHSLAFLDKARSGLAKTVAKPVLKVSKTPDDLLSEVAGGELAAALVDFAAFDGFQILQPGTWKSLRILAESEAFPAAVVAYRKGALTDEEAAKLQKGLASAHETASGKMLMMLWNIRSLNVPPADHQERLDAILKAYPLPAK